MDAAAGNRPSHRRERKGPSSDIAAINQDRRAAGLRPVRLEGEFDAYHSQLSGCQQQRVAIARTLAMRPNLLLCDEITSALYPELVSEVLRVVEQLASEGMTLMPVPHECA